MLAAVRWTGLGRESDKAKRVLAEMSQCVGSVSRLSQLDRRQMFCFEFLHWLSYP